MRIAIIITAFLFLLSACAQMQNLTVADVRTPKMFRQSGSIAMSPDEARHCAELTNYHCGPAGGAQIVADPDGSGAFSMFIYGGGLTQANPYVIIDYTPTAHGTGYKAYCIQRDWEYLIHQQIDRIEACGECSKLN